MKYKEYLFQYIKIMIFNMLIVGFTIFVYIAFDHDGENYSLTNWLETFISISICYLIIPVAIGYFLFKSIRSNNRDLVKNLPLYSIFSLIPCYSIWHFGLCIPDAVNISNLTFDPVTINILLILSYINFVIPLFVTYMLVSNIRKKVKKDLYTSSSILFDPGVTKIWQKLFLMVLLISIFPVIILYIDGYVNFDRSLGDNRRILSNIDLGLVTVSIIISMIIITKDITDPVNNLIKSFKTIREGDLSKRMAVTTHNELGVLIHNFNLMADGLEEREKIKGIFSQYVSPGVAERILYNEDFLKGEERTATVLFTDIKGYTSISERLSPSENINLLNEYYGVLVRIVKGFGGTVNKFMGDAIMVIFNAPLDDPDHSVNAVNCGKKIIEETNIKFFGNNIKLITRVGINTGPVIAGRLGGMDRYEYTIVGDTVNIAQRLEQFNKRTDTQLLLSHETANRLNGDVEVKKIGRATVKGKSEKVIVYTTV